MVDYKKTAIIGTILFISILSSINYLSVDDIKQLLDENPYSQIIVASGLKDGQRIEIISRSIDPNISYYKYRLEGNQLKAYIERDLIYSSEWALYNGTRRIVYRETKNPNLTYTETTAQITEEMDYFLDSRHTNYIGTLKRIIHITPNFMKETINFTSNYTGLRLQYLIFPDNENNGISIDLDENGTTYFNFKDFLLNWSVDSDKVSSVYKKGYPYAPDRIWINFKRNEYNIDPTIRIGLYEIYYDIANKTMFGKDIGREYKADLTYGDLPIVLKVNRDMLLPKNLLKILKRHSQNLEFKNSYIEIATNKTINHSKWISNISCQVIGYNITNLSNGTIINQTLTNCTDNGYWNNWTDWKWEWKKLNKDVMLKANEFYLINIHADWKAGLGERKVDVVPSINNLPFSDLAWWNVNWHVRKQLNFTSTQSANNYAVRVNITYDSDMQSDFDDIRFIDNDNELEYWLENKSDGNWAVYWVKVNLTNGVKSIYVYYGNPSATTTAEIFSNFFEHIRDILTFDADNDKVYSIKDGTEWTATKAGSPTVEGKDFDYNTGIQVDNTDTSNYYYFNLSDRYDFENNFYIEFTTNATNYLSGSATPHRNIISKRVDTEERGDYIVDVDTNETGITIEFYLYEKSATSNAVSCYKDGIEKIRRLGVQLTNNSNQVNFYVNGENICTESISSSYLKNNTQPFYISYRGQEEEYGSGSFEYIVIGDDTSNTPDSILYLETEPTQTWGSEEQFKIIKYFDSNLNNTNPFLGEYVKFSARWTTDTGSLNEYIFSWNASGSWVNDTAVSFSETNNSWSNITKLIETSYEGECIGWKIYADLETGEKNATKTETFTVKRTELKVSLNAPSNKSWDNTDVSFNYTPISALGIKKAYLYTNESGNWASVETNDSIITNNTINTIEHTFTSNGTFIWAIKIENENGYTNFSANNYTIKIDWTEPYVNITRPKNETYSSVELDFNFSVSDKESGVDICWYSLNNNDNKTLPGCQNTTIGLDEMVDGLNHLILYANDSAGNVNKSEVYFTNNIEKIIEWNFVNASNFTWNGPIVGQDNYWMQPIGQGDLGILNHSNNESVVVDIQYKLNGILTSGWTIWATNSSDKNGGFVLSNNTWTTIYDDLPVNENKTIWLWANVTEAGSYYGCGVDIMFRAVIT